MSLSVTTPAEYQVAGRPDAVEIAAVDTGNLTVTLSTNNGGSFPYTLRTGIANTATLVWYTIPSGIDTATAKIRVSDGVTTATTDAFTIAPSQTVEQLVPGGGSSEVVIEETESTVVTAKWGIVDHEDATGVFRRGIAAWSAADGGQVAFVKVRMDGGDWVTIAQPTLATYRIPGTLNWTEPADFELRGKVEYQFDIDADDIDAAGSVIQAYAVDHQGNARILPDVTVYKTDASRPVIYFGSGGNNSNDGLTEPNRKATLGGALIAAWTGGADTKGGLLLCTGGTHSLEDDGSVRNNARFVHVRPTAGATWATTKLVGHNVSADYWQLKRTWISMKLDFDPANALDGSGMGQTNQSGLLVFDNYEMVGPGIDVEECSNFNGFTILALFAGYEHQMSGYNAGGVIWQTAAEQIAHVYCFECGGDRGKTPTYWDNFVIRDQGQDEVLDQHSDVIQLVADPGDNWIVQNCEFDQAYTFHNSQDRSLTGGALVNIADLAVTGYVGGSDNRGWSNMLMLHVSTDRNWSYNDPASSSGSRFRGNVLGQIIQSDGDVDDATWDANHFIAGTEIGTESTDGAFSVDPDTYEPPSLDAPYSAGQATLSYDLWGNIRGATTAKGPASYSGETVPEGGDNASDHAASPIFSGFGFGFVGN